MSMNSLRRTRMSVQANLRSLTREPFTIALLLFMPIVSIRLYGLSVGSIADLGLFETAVSLQTIGMVTGAIFAAGGLAGILGLFQSLSVRTADRRLAISGYDRTELVAARFATVVATALIVAVVTTISLDWSVSDPLDSIGITVAGLFLVGVLYGLLGILVGSVLPRALEGSLVLVALADVSAIVASGLFGIDDSLARLFPMSHPHDIVQQAAVEGSLVTAQVLPALGYLLVVMFLAGAAYIRVLPAGGDAT